MQSCEPWIWRTEVPVVARRRIRQAVRPRCVPSPGHGLIVCSVFARAVAATSVSWAASARSRSPLDRPKNRHDAVEMFAVIERSRPVLFAISSAGYFYGSGSGLRGSIPSRMAAWS